MVNKYFTLRRNVFIETAFLIWIGMLFHDFAPAYLIDFKLYYSVNIRVGKMSLLAAGLV